MNLPLVIVFADEDNIVHLLAFNEVHVTALRTSMSVEYRGRAYHVKPQTTFQICDPATGVAHFNTTSALLNSAGGTA